MNASQVSIIIPCRNEAESIGRLLESLRLQSVQGFEVLVIDGESADGTLEVVRKFSEVRVVSNALGTIPAALNLGIRSTQREIVIRLDAHSLPRVDYVEKCLQAMIEPQAEVVGGLWEVKAGAATMAAEAIAVAVSSPLGAGDASYRLSSSKAGVVDTVPFGCFRRATWEAVGGYDEMLLANEDYEFYLRVRQHGGRIYFSPTIRCEYFARPTFKLLAQQYWRYGWWKAQMLRRHPHSIRIRQLIPILWSMFSLIALFIPTLWIAWGIYLMVVLIESIKRGREMRKILYLTCAYVIIHFAWGWGVWVGWMKRLRM